MTARDKNARNGGMEDTPSYLRIGRILKPQGLKGEVKVEITSEDPQRFLDLADAYLERRGELTAVSVLSSALREGSAYLTLQGIDSREDAETLRGAYLSVPRSQAIPLPEGRWFIVDLLGCAVCDETGRDYGHLVDIHQYGAADIYVMRPPEGQADLWVPLTEDLLLEVDVESKRIRINGEAAKLRGVWNPR